MPLEVIETIGGDSNYRDNSSYRDRGIGFYMGIMKIATPSWGGDFVLFVLLLVLFEELGDEGGDFFGAAANAVVFTFDDGEL